MDFQDNDVEMELDNQDIDRISFRSSSSRNKDPKFQLRRDQCLMCNGNVRPLFRFPKETHKTINWLALLGKSFLIPETGLPYIINNGRICPNHFEETSFTSTLRTHLSKFAMPIDIREKQLSSHEPFVSHEPACPPWFCLKPVHGGKGDSETPVRPTVSASDNLYVPVKVTPKTGAIRRLRVANSKLKKKLFKIENSRKLELQDSLTAKQYEFVLGQLRNGKRAANGRRWTAKEKAFALDIFLHSSNSYSTLKKSLILPSEKTLRNCTKNVAKDDGICPILLEALKRKVQELPEEEKICTLVFDEMAIKSALKYNPKLDRVDGYETVDNSSDGCKLATQALVFMLRGVMKNWKQVIAYYFRGNTSSQGWLKTKVLHVIQEVMSAGLKVIAIVCDQGSLTDS